MNFPLLKLRAFLVASGMESFYRRKLRNLLMNWWAGVWQDAFLAETCGLFLGTAAPFGDLLSKFGLRVDGRDQWHLVGRAGRIDADFREVHVAAGVAVHTSCAHSVTLLAISL
ncbi:MAG: hypothetical protein Q7S84_03640 [bacterium]|nr:hypothetical protein [bacterium]